MDGAFKSLKNLGKMCDELEEEGRNGEERGKGENRARVDEGFI